MFHVRAMGGVLEQLVRPSSRRQQIIPLHCRRIDMQVLELETAKEILGEVFDTTQSEVEEMIRQRIAERMDI